MKNVTKKQAIGTSWNMSGNEHTSKIGTTKVEYLTETEIWEHLRGYQTIPVRRNGTQQHSGAAAHTENLRNKDKYMKQCFLVAFHLILNESVILLLILQRTRGERK